MLISALVLASGLAASGGHAPDPPASAPRVAAHRITAAQGAPAIDGRLDDGIWAAADSIDGLTQTQPDAGKPARFRTVARLAVDDQAVYVAIRAYDPDPSRIAAQLTRRDEDSPSDWLFVALDSRHDLRTAYVFGVNPLGVKRDFTVVDGGGDERGWDPVWQVETRRDSLGWTAEYRIPLAVLRYAPDGEGVWGLQITRFVQREQELARWGYTPPDEPRRVARFGKVEGMRGLPSPRRLEVLPYTVAGVSRAPHSDSPFYRSNDPNVAMGVDVKYGITSDLTLDLTVNPDFGQVEADPSQVNLSAFETFVSERRPFFTEGADIFRFGIALGDGDDANEQLFYSRRVGRAPQGRADLRGGWVDAPGQTNILTAAKLSGRVKGDWSVGAMSAVTGRETALVRDRDGAEFTDVVEPLTSYSMLRVRRDLNAGRTQIGAVATGVVRDLDETDLDWLNSSAVTGGVDVSHRWANDQWIASGFLLGSSIRGSTEAILRAQRSPARYYQRPDADHLRLDTAVSMEGWAANYMVGKIAGRWRVGALGQVRSPGFEVNDLGYQRDADQVVTALYGGLREFEPGAVFRNYGINVNAYTASNFGWERVSTGFNTNGNAQFLNYWNGYAGVNHNLASVGTGFTRGGPALAAPARTNGWFGFQSDGRKTFVGGMNGNWGVEHGAESWRLRLGPSGRWRVSSSTSVELNPFYSVNQDAWQYVGQPADTAGVRHYLFAGMDQRTVGATVRLNQTFTPRMSLQLYAQPFVSAGRYATLREVVGPRAGDFDERFRSFDEAAVSRGESEWTVDRNADGVADLTLGNPEFNVRDLNLNAVLRWEYRMGSTLFVAWSHGRNDFERTGDFRPRRDFDALFGRPSTNVLMIKANWWLNW